MLPKWVDQGLVMLSNHEPLTFRIRRGRHALDAPQQFAYEHSEEFVRKAAQFGITCLRTHYYKGGGIKYESPEMRMTADFVKLCHKYGIRVQGYVQHGTITYETLYLEEPKYRNWVAMDQYGLKTSITYGYQFFRYKPCFNQKGMSITSRRLSARVSPMGWICSASTIPRGRSSPRHASARCARPGSASFSTASIA